MSDFVNTGHGQCAAARHRDQLISHKKATAQDFQKKARAAFLATKTCFWNSRNSNWFKQAKIWFKPA